MDDQSFSASSQTTVRPHSFNMLHSSFCRFKLNLVRKTSYKTITSS